MKLIDQIDSKFFPYATGDELLKFIEKHSTTGSMNIARYSNINKSDYVLALLGMMFRVVDRRALPYSDLEIKMNIALKKFQSFDFNSTVQLGLVNDYSSRRINRYVLEDYMIGNRAWNTIAFSALARTSTSMNGTISLSNSLAVHKTDMFAKTLYAPVIRLDKFEEFRRNFMFAGQLNWKNVTYWINEDFFNKNYSKEEGRYSFYAMWIDKFWSQLKQADFRVEIVPNSEFEKLLYHPPRQKNLTIPQLREQSKSIILQARDICLVESKPSMMMPSVRDNLERDYLSQFMATQVTTTEEELVSAEDTDVEPSEMTENVRVVPDVQHVAQEENPNLTDAHGNAVSVEQVSQGILGQIQQQTTYSELTIQDLENVIESLSQSQPQSPHNTGIAADISAPPGWVSTIDPASAGIPPGEHYVYMSPRRVGRSNFMQNEAIARASQEMQTITRIVEQRRNEGGVLDFADLIQTYGQEAVQMAIRILDERNLIMQRLMRQYPLTPDEAFNSSEQRSESQEQERAAEMYRENMRIMMDEGNISPIRGGLSPQVQQWINIQRMTVEEASRMYGIPPQELAPEIPREEVESNVSDLAMANAMALIAEEQIAHRDAIEEETSEEDLIITQNELEHEQRTLESQENDTNSSRSSAPESGSEIGDDNGPFVPGGDSAFSEEETEIF